MTDEKMIRCFGCGERFPESDMWWWDAVGYWLCADCLAALGNQKDQLLSDVVDQLVVRYGPRKVVQAVVDDQASSNADARVPWDLNA